MQAVKSEVSGACAPKWFMIGMLTFMVAACTGTGSRVDQPLTRKFAWFSYLNGDDIRERCTAGRWEVRLVYNGNYEKQVRSYHIVGDGGGGAYVTARATPGDYGTLTRLSLSDPLQPWRWRKSDMQIDGESRDVLAQSLARSGIYEPAPDGMRLPSWAWYWVSIACRDGEVFFNAWTYPSERWDRVRFREALAPYDETGVPFNQPQRAAPFKPAGTSPDEKGGSSHFQLTVGRNGLTGTTRLF